MLKNGKVIESQQFQRQHNKSKIYLYSLRILKYGFFKVSLIFFLLLCGILAWQKCSDPNFFPVNHIKINGDLNRVKRKDLKQIILPFINKGFLRFDSNQLKDRLLQEPWIASVTVKRFWPDTIAVRFFTRIPVALLNNNRLLDEQGNIFSVDHKSVAHLKLPLFLGPLNQQKHLLQIYQSMQLYFNRLALKIELLKLFGQEHWYLRLNNGLVLYLNYEEPYTQLGRFVEIYPNIIESKVSMIDYIDLRYSHGMAVKFKKHIF